jgi:hypothetical protein
MTNLFHQELFYHSQAPTHITQNFDMKAFSCFGVKGSAEPSPIPNGNTGKELCAE